MSVTVCDGCLQRPERVSDSLELELQTVVSHHGGAGNQDPNPGSLPEQLVLLTTKPSHQLLSHSTVNWPGSGHKWEKNSNKPISQTDLLTDLTFCPKKTFPSPCSYLAAFNLSISNTLLTYCYVMIWIGNVPKRFTSWVTSAQLLLGDCKNYGTSGARRSLALGLREEDIVPCSEDREEGGSLPRREARPQWQKPSYNTRFLFWGGLEAFKVFE